MSEERNERCIDWRIKMLEVGTKAPDFELLDQNGELHKLSEYLGKKVYFSASLIGFILN
jgi:peroxiredoxin